MIETAWTCGVTLKDLRPTGEKSVLILDGLISPRTKRGDDDRVGGGGLVERKSRAE
jgi:hypothetical protein